MTTRVMQDEILRLKKEKGVCILVHAYQDEDIWEIADYVGDSFGLSQEAARAQENTVLMCGVRFMAETVKILAPQKRVFLSHPQAGCPMADHVDEELLAQIKAETPSVPVAAYVNTTAAVKALCDVCVTSSSAVKILKNYPADKFIFLPDPNLGAYIQSQLPEKSFELLPGGCPTHLRLTEKDIAAARAAHPEALILMHPECHPRVAALADYLGSTTQILSFAEKSDKKEFVIATENSIVEHLKFRCPDKKFYPLSRDCVCHNMRLTTLPDVYRFLATGEGEEIELAADLIEKARRPIDAMLRYGG